mgnify:FL=1
MNIFVLSEEPREAAQMVCDKHCSKMIIESGQMLSTAHRMLDGNLEVYINANGRKARRYNLNDWRQQVLYKAVHYHHPCTVWTMESSENYKWHWQHLEALCAEYRFRYGKIHKTETTILHALKDLPKNIPIAEMTNFRLAMGSNPECMDENDIIGSYRAFYQTKQSRFKMRWTDRPVPSWFSYQENAK